jgi:hydroxylamine reductase
MEEMFCYQCEQAAGGTGCTKMGVCGKTPEAAAIQDLIVWGLKGMAFWADQARQKGAINRDIDVFMIEALFTTVTNVDFDTESLTRVARQVSAMRDKAQQLFEKAAGGPHAGEVPAAARPWSPPATVAQAVAEGRKHPVKDPSIDPDVHSVQQILIYGCKGMSAYADHAHILGRDDDAIYGFIHKAMAATLDKSKGLMDFVNLAMECGKMNIQCRACSTRRMSSAFSRRRRPRSTSAPRPARVSRLRP